MKRANEAAMMFATREEQLRDKATFVENLGWLLSQTRDDLEKCELKPNDPDTVVITYFCGFTREVNIHMDSYAAIVRDVAKNFQ